MQIILSFYIFSEEIALTLNFTLRFEPKTLNMWQKEFRNHCSRTERNTAVIGVMESDSL